MKNYRYKQQEKIRTLNKSGMDAIHVYIYTETCLNELNIFGLLNSKKWSLVIFMAYVADVVGIALGLEELRHIRGQRVLLMDLLQTLLVEELQGKTAIRADVTCAVLQSKKERVFFFNYESGSRLTSLLWSWLTLACIMVGWSSMDVKGIVSGCCLYFFCRKQVN